MGTIARRHVRFGKRDGVYHVNLRWQPGQRRRPCRLTAIRTSKNCCWTVGLSVLCCAVLPRAAPARMMKSLCAAEHKCVKTLRWNASPRHRLTGYSAVLIALFLEGRAHGSWFCHHDLCAVLLIMSKRHRTMNARLRFLGAEVYLHGAICLLGRRSVRCGLCFLHPEDFLVAC